MRLYCILLVVAATFACSDTTTTAERTKLLKLQIPDLVQSNDVTLNNKDSRVLRKRDVNTDNEERAVNLKKIFDFKKWFGMGKNSAANVAIRKGTTANKVVRKNHAVDDITKKQTTANKVVRNNHAVDNAVKKQTATNNAVRNHNAAGNIANADDVGNDFALVHLENMLSDSKFKRAMFKKWDKVPMENIKHSIGEANLNNEAIAKMVVDYVQHRRVYNQVKAS